VVETQSADTHRGETMGIANAPPILRHTDNTTRTSFWASWRQLARPGIQVFL